MRVLVCGSRDWADRATVYSVLDEIAPTTIREGCYRGADKIAEDYALSRHLPCEHYPAQWGTRGKAAGPERNERMLRGEALGRPPEGPPDLVVAFDLGTPGTSDMVSRAIQAGFRVRVITPAGVGLGL